MTARSEANRALWQEAIERARNTHLVRRPTLDQVDAQALRLLVAKVCELEAELREMRAKLEPTG